MRMFIPGAILLLSPFTILAGPCLPGTLQSYLNLGSTGCEVGSRLFTNFTLWRPTSLTVMDPTVVKVTPTGSLSQPELVITPNYTAIGPNQYYGLLFDFVITGELTGTSLAFTTPTTSGQGSVFAFLDVCPGGFFTFAPSGCDPAPPYLSANVGAGSNKPNSSMQLPHANFYHVSLHLYLQTGTGILDSASLNSAALAFNTVPEPDLAPLMLAILAVLGIRARQHP